MKAPRFKQFTNSDRDLALNELLRPSTTDLKAPLSVLISILNWNDAKSTAACVRAVLGGCANQGITSRILVIDNGSAPDDYASLIASLSGIVEIKRVPENLGFAGGHNLAIQYAIEAECDYIWLLNNDAIVSSDTLTALVESIEADPKCGMISPLIFSEADHQKVDFVGAVHDWAKLDSERAGTPEQSKQMLAADPDNFVVWGTAPLIRVSALREVGALNEGYFAYFEDDELGARFSNSGWRSKMAFDTAIVHRRRKDINAERPPYYFYLMARNSILFFVAQTPAPHRRWIRVRLFSRILIKAAILRERGFTQKYHACLLGGLDGLRNRNGRPRDKSIAPIWLRAMSRALPYRLQLWLDR